MAPEQYLAKLNAQLQAQLAEQKLILWVIFICYLTITISQFLQARALLHIRDILQKMHYFEAVREEMRHEREKLSKHSEAKA